MTSPKKPISFLDRKEVEQIIASIRPEGERNLRDRALIETLFSTGLRIAECLALPDAPFMKETDGTMELSITGKGGFPRTVYFSPQALKTIRDYLAVRDDTSTLLFPLTRRAVGYMIKKRAATAGITKRVHPHCLRHSLATDLLKQGVDIAFVSKFLGHRSLDNTMIYAHIVNNDLKKIHQELYK